VTLPRFAKRFTQAEAIPEAGVEAALRVLRSGRLHRYDADGEEGEAQALEREFAAWQGARFALALASGGQAMQVALRAAGVTPGEPVLTNAWTLAPVPGAIVAAGAQPVLVEATEDLVIDLADLAAKARASGSRWLLLSHMRGHLCDMDALVELCAALGVAVIEDCAHTMGARWDGRRSGSFGLAACFSTQGYKHLNSGEGGLLTSDDEALMARATILSGSYMLHARHGAGPPEAAFAGARLDQPNLSARMDHLRAAILRPQLAGIEEAVARWRARHARVARALAQHPAIRLPRRPPQAALVGSSVQVLLDGIAPARAEAFVTACAARGVSLKWFGAEEPQGYTSAHASWRFVPPQPLPRTDRVLAGLFDMRLPLTFTPEDCDLVAAHLLGAVNDVVGQE
jgi:dTDP-4-amino-4,6-dideoxygalactose transaminase